MKPQFETDTSVTIFHSERLMQKLNELMNNEQKFFSTARERDAFYGNKNNFVGQTRSQMKAERFKALKEIVYQKACAAIEKKCLMTQGFKNTADLKESLFEFYPNPADPKRFFHKYMERMVNDGLIVRVRIGYYVVPDKNKS